MIPAGETLRLAGIALTRNKMRSFLTALGIIIGVGAVIFMQSIGEGAKSRVRAQIEGAGTNIVMLFSGSSQGPGGRGGQGSQPTITWEDLRAIQTELASVAAVAPQMNAGQPVISETNTWNTRSRARLRTSSPSATGRYRAGLSSRPRTRRVRPRTR
jgi:putative ABC transport system permease protein